MAAGGFGTMPLGSGPYGSGAVFTLQFVECFVRGSNEIWVVVDSLSGLRATDPASELSPKNWNIQSLSVDAFPRFVQAIEVVETRDDAIRAGALNLFEAGFVPALRALSDGPLSPDKPYLLSYTGLGSQRCQIQALLVEPLAFQRLATQDDGAIEDFKNPQIERDKLPLGALGSFNITDTGDLGIDNGIESLRKRILRRISTAVSGFYHLPNYGTDLESKSSITPDLARRIKQRVNNGVRSEPDVLNAKTSVYSVRNEEGMIVVQVTATTRFGETVTVSEQVRVSG